MMNPGREKIVTSTFDHLDHIIIYAYEPDEQVFCDQISVMPFRPVTDDKLQTVLLMETHYYIF